MKRGVWPPRPPRKLNEREGEDENVKNPLGEREPEAPFLGPRVRKIFFIIGDQSTCPAPGRGTFYWMLIVLDDVLCKYVYIV